MTSILNAFTSPNRDGVDSADSACCFQTFISSSPSSSESLSNNKTFSEYKHDSLNNSSNSLKSLIRNACSPEFSEPSMSSDKISRDLSDGYDSANVISTDSEHSGDTKVLSYSLSPNLDNSLAKGLPVTPSTASTSYALPLYPTYNNNTYNQMTNTNYFFSAGQPVLINQVPQLLQSTGFHNAPHVSTSSVPINKHNVYLAEQKSVPYALRFEAPHNSNNQFPDVKCQIIDKNVPSNRLYLPSAYSYDYANNFRSCNMNFYQSNSIRSTHQTYVQCYPGNFSQSPRSVASVDHVIRNQCNVNTEQFHAYQSNNSLCPRTVSNPLKPIVNEQTYRPISFDPANVNQCANLNATRSSMNSFVNTNTASIVSSTPVKVPFKSYQNVKPELNYLPTNVSTTQLTDNKSKQKRRGSKVNEPCGKRRRSFDVQPNHAVSNSVQIETILRSISDANLSKYIQNPSVVLSLNLYSPSPCSRNTSSTECNFSEEWTGYKYLHFPFSLTKPETKPVSEKHLLHFISRLNVGKSWETLFEENFLIESYKRAISRNYNTSSYFSPSTPQNPSSPLVDFDKKLTTSDGRVTPPLNNNIKSNESSNMKSEENIVHTYPYREEIVKLHPLSSNTTCASCAMQIVPFNKPFIHKHSDVFCSHNCFLNFKKQPNSVNQSNLPFDINYSTVTTTLTDGKDEPITVFILKTDTKSSKTCNKREQKALKKRYVPDFVKFNRLALGYGKKWHNIRWLKWNSNCFNNKSIKSKKLSSSSSSNSNLLSNVLISSHPDRRMCSLCQSYGDESNNVNSRLLNYDIGSWLHLNCILWCYETYETVSGSLVDVFRSVEKALKTSCTLCKKFGAGIPCFNSDCQVIYHLPCAKLAGCSFHVDRSMYCKEHSVDGDEPILDDLAVNRRVYITRDEDEQVAKVFANVDRICKLRIGTLILHRIGQLLPDQLESGAFHNSDFIFPVGFWSTRIYWSYRHIGHRCRYDCHIEDSSSDQKKSVKFVVEVTESNEVCDHFVDITCNGVWQQIFAKINELRSSHSSLKIFSEHIQGEKLYGLTEPQIVRAIESLPEVSHLNDYMFKFEILRLIKEMPLALNPSGCARSEPKLHRFIRRKLAGENLSNTIAHTLISPRLHECSSFSSVLEIGSPSYLNNNHSPNLSKSQQYKRLRLEWRTNVLLARSRIQGLGLYAARDMNRHTFIIEYLGEVIRNEVANLRERLYESQNRGIYMFRVDDDWIVDATMCGGLARYINHSCDPNCSAEILNCDSGSHIVIIACKNILKGEELTYDYKFDLEEDRWDRIPCLCGSTNCRKWMN